MAHATVVCTAYQHEYCKSYPPSTGEGCSAAARRHKKPPFVAENETGSLPLVRESLRRQGICGQAAKIVLSSWRNSTQKQYKCFHKKWIFYCRKRKTSMFRPSVADVIAFLTELYENSTGYSGLNSARCALSAISLTDQTYTIGKHPLVSRFIKGCFELRPPSCRYSQIWDVSRVLNYLRTQHPLASVESFRRKSFPPSGNTGCYLLCNILPLEIATPESLWTKLILCTNCLT